MDGRSNPISNIGQQPDDGQAEYPTWITPALIAEAKEVLRTSHRLSTDQAAIDLVVSLGRLLDAAGTLKGERP
jgi:hypothetical protein